MMVAVHACNPGVFYQDSTVAWHITVHTLGRLHVLQK